MRNSSLVAVLVLFVSGCGSSTSQETTTVVEAPPPEAPPPEEPLADEEPPPVEEPAPPEIVRVPCESYQQTARRGGGFDRTRVEIATTWEPGHAPEALSRADAEARGATETDAGDLERTMALAEGTQAFFQYDEHGRASGARITRGRNSYLYTFVYECSGIAVIGATNYSTQCRVVDGPAIVCPGDEEPMACTEISRADLTDAEGEEVLYGCVGDCGEAGEGARHAHVIVAGSAPVWAVASGDPSACQTATVVARPRGQARLRFEGRGEDGTFQTEWSWTDGAIAMTRGRFREP